MFRKSMRLAAVMAVPVIGLWGGSALAQPVNLNGFCEKGGHAAGEQQPWVPFETRTTSPDGSTTLLTTAGGTAVFPEGDPFSPNPPNMLPTIYENAKTCRGNEIPNTLPSTPENPYNLHDDPVARPIDKTSPTDDLDWIMDEIERAAAPRILRRNFRRFQFRYAFPRRGDTGEVRDLPRYAVDIIEGNTLSG